MLECSYPFTRILIPYDGSAAAQRGLVWAAHLARIEGGSLERLTLMRVIGSSYLARHLQNVDLRVTRIDEVDTWRRLRQRLKDEIQSSLDQARETLQEMGLTIPVETLITEGRVGEEITRQAAEGAYNAVVMGRRGLSLIKGLLLGSVTHRVLSLAQKMTIIVVGEEAAFNPETPISPLLCPVDGSESSLAAVCQTAALTHGLKNDQISLTLLHVIELAEVTAMIEASSLVHEGERILAESRRILLEAGFPGKIEDKLLIGDPPKMIVEEAEAGNYALILMGARGLSPLKQLILGSASNEVLHRVNRAVIGVVYP